MPDTLGMGTERRRCLRPGAIDWAVGAAGFKLSHLGNSAGCSPSAGGRWAGKKQQVLPVPWSAAFQTCQFISCWGEHQGNHMQKEPLRETSLLRARTASRQGTLGVREEKAGDFYLFILIFFCFVLFFSSAPFSLKVGETPDLQAGLKGKQNCTDKPTDNQIYAWHRARSCAPQQAAILKSHPESWHLLCEVVQMQGLATWEQKVWE